MKNIFYEMSFLSKHAFFKQFQVQKLAYKTETVEFATQNIHIKYYLQTYTLEICNKNN